jgi:HAE1 family hydrophobic/amphiphilic exporter-1
MQKLAEICIRRPIFASMLILALVVVGGAAYHNLAVDRFPAVDLPTVSVRTTLPGAPPELVETDITDRVEEAVNTVQGISELRSITGPGTSAVIVTFDLNRDIDVAAQDVRDRVATITRDLQLVGADPPVIRKYNNDDTPVMTIALAGPRTQKELGEIADKIVKIQLERASGVGEVDIVGGLERAMNIWVDSDKLAAYKLPVTQVREAVLRQSADIPGGNLTNAQEERTVRMPGRLSKASEFDEIVVARKNGQVIRVKDIGHAEDGTKERRGYSMLNDEPTVVLEVHRQSGENTVATIDAVKAKLEQVKRQLPPDIRVEVIRDQSRYIESALHEINLHLVLGSILASLVVLAFMRNWRSTLIAAVAIPTSVIATFGMMWWLHFTLNSVTMLALVLMVGVVIDDAIVVLENIYRFIEEKKMNPFDAAREATREIGLAVLATTLSLVVIFVPVSFMSSISGRFLYQFGITAAVAVLVSLLVSFTLTPTMSARLLKAGKTDAEHGGSRRGFYHLIDASYTWMLRLSMRWRWGVAILAAAVIAMSVPLYRTVKQEYVPSDVDEAEFQVTFTGPEGASIESMSDAMKEIEPVVRNTRGVSLVLTTIGGGFLGQVNTGNMYVRIQPHEKRLFSLGRLWRETLAGHPMQAFAGNYSQRDVMSDLRKKLRKYAQLRPAVRNYPSFNIGGGNYDIDFVIKGPELSELAKYAETLRNKTLPGPDGQAEIPGLEGIDTTLKLDKPELQIHINRNRADDLGIAPADVGEAVRLLIGGDDRVSRFEDEQLGEAYDVELRLLAKDRLRLSQLENLFLPRRVLNGAADGGLGAPGGSLSTDGSDMVLTELSSIANLETVPSASRIDRLDRERTVSVRGTVAAGYAQADRIQAMRDAAAKLNLPQGYTTTISGRGRELERTFTEFLWAFLLSVIFMYIILASQYESLVHPFTILLSLPMSVPFALLSLYWSGNTLNLYSALGILVLFGVVKKNAILQIDHMNQLRKKGYTRYDAIIQGNRDRLRPILMTTLALVAGMLPLWLGTGPGAEERRAVAVVVIGGQSLSLLLTLLVTPVVYSLLDDAGTIVLKLRRRRGFEVEVKKEAAEPVGV